MSCGHLRTGRAPRERGPQPSQDTPSPVPATPRVSQIRDCTRSGAGATFANPHVILEHGAVMETTDLTIEILTGIRQELRDTRDSLGSRIDATNERLDSMREELSRRIVESEIRTSTAIADLP